MRSDKEQVIQMYLGFQKILANIHCKNIRGSLNNYRGKSNVLSWIRNWQSRTEMNGDKVISQHKSSKIHGYCDWYHDMTCLVFLCVQYGSF